MDNDVSKVFEAFTRAAPRHSGSPDGLAPYDYPTALAVDGPAEVLEVPTGAGKTVAVPGHVKVPVGGQLEVPTSAGAA